MLFRSPGPHIVVHETSDPEVIVAEWDYDGLVTTTNRSFQVSNIRVSRVRNGQIVASRDYHNHLVLADVLGRLPALLAALAKRRASVTSAVTAVIADGASRAFGASRPSHAGRGSGSLWSMTSPVSADPAGHADAPSWFRAALAASVEPGSVAVDGTMISYRAYGRPEDGGIVLVHGGAAHARWWDHIAPLLARGRRVVALDLSGHGDSDRRDAYNLDLWAHEVLAVASAAGITGPPIVIGHSMGGFVALRVAGLYGTQIEGVVVIDSPVRDITPEERAARDQRAFGPLRVYPTRKAAIARFRPIPDQPVLDWIAGHPSPTASV